MRLAPEAGHRGSRRSSSNCHSLHLSRKRRLIRSIMVADVCCAVRTKYIQGPLYVPFTTISTTCSTTCCVACCLTSRSLANSSARLLRHLRAQTRSIPSRIIVSAYTRSEPSSSSDASQKMGRGSVRLRDGMRLGVVGAACFCLDLSSTFDAPRH